MRSNVLLLLQLRVDVRVDLGDVLYHFSGFLFLLRLFLCVLVLVDDVLGGTLCVVELLVHVQGDFGREAVQLGQPLPRVFDCFFEFLLHFQLNCPKPHVFVRESSFLALLFGGHGRAVSRLCGTLDDLGWLRLEEVFLNQRAFNLTDPVERLQSFLEDSEHRMHKLFQLYALHELTLQLTLDSVLIHLRQNLFFLYLQQE